MKYILSIFTLICSSSCAIAMDKPLPLIVVTPHSTPHQRNCFFLAAVYNAKTNPIENHLFIKKSFEEEKNHDFSCYMNRLRQDHSQEKESFAELESHINPFFIAEHNKDQQTRDLLRQYEYVQTKITQGIFYFPSPLLWACIGNNIEQAKTALADIQLEKLSKDSEQIVDCVHVAMQHCNTALADLLLQHDTIGKIYFSCGSSRSPRAQHDDTTEKSPGLSSVYKKMKRLSDAKEKKNRAKKTS